MSPWTLQMWQFQQENGFRGDAGHRNIKIRLGWEFIYFHLEDMPLGNFTGKNIVVTVHVLAPWPHLSFRTPFGAPNSDHGAIIWMVTRIFM